MLNGTAARFPPDPRRAPFSGLNGGIWGASIVAGLLFSSPARATDYYVSPGGQDTAAGTAEAPFATVQHAHDQTQPGDTVFLMDGEHVPSCDGCYVLDVTHSGRADAWITYRAVPGQHPVLKFDAWAGIHLAAGASYIEVRDLEIVGQAKKLDTAACTPPTANPGQCNGAGISVDGRKDGAQHPHHVRVAHNHIHDCGGGGVQFIQSDYITVEDNLIHENAWFTEYAMSGISIWQAWRADDVTDYKIIVRRNTVYLNKTQIPWSAIGKLSDGNGIIIDDFENTQNGSALGPYTGRTLVENNVSFGNGGSGIHTYLSQHVDIVNNTAFMNGQVVGYPEIYAQESNDVRILNNILYARPQADVTSNYKNTNVTYDYNVYFNGKPAAVSGSHDINADPGFVQASLRGDADFHLRPTSPAVGSGSTEVRVEDDHDGRARPLGAAPDRGAYELATLQTGGGSGGAASTGAGSGSFAGSSAVALGGASGAVGYGGANGAVAFGGASGGNLDGTGTSATAGGAAKSGAGCACSVPVERDSSSRALVVLLMACTLGRVRRRALRLHLTTSASPEKSRAAAN